MTVLMAAWTLDSVVARADGLDDVVARLEQGAAQDVQEKVYVHTDNQCYFVGDTLWWKAYVVRADDLRPTDMSRLLYVELLSPDGLLVERQTVVVSATGHSCGQFALRDSLYSGYYELRAYTRWMLNFGVRWHRYSRHDTWHFYNRQMAADYFRIWDGLFSRAIPIYSKPEQAGDYDARRMYQRPKTRLPRKKKDDLQVTFYPEGGHLVRGARQRVAFEVMDQHGEAQQVRGRLSDGTTIATEFMGRGSCMVEPGDKRLKATFTWRGRDWSFDLPKAEADGVALTVEDDGRVTLAPRGAAAVARLGVTVMSGGRVRFFTAADREVNVPWGDLPSGVAQVTVFDEEGRVWADRLCFVNNHEFDRDIITTDWDARRTLQPYEKAEVTLSVASDSSFMTGGTVMSVAIRDAGTEEPTYDDGDILTTLLLQSELRGFVARPQYYFESDDATHRRHLDLLMLVQGWRRYRWQEMAMGEHPLRYEPEKTLTIEGAVYKTLSINDVEAEEILSWQDGVGMVGRSTALEEDGTDPFADTGVDEGGVPTGSGSGSDLSQLGSIEYGNIGDANSQAGVNHGGLRHEVMVEAEVSVGTQVVGASQLTHDGGRFLFEVPPFYGDAYLNMKAYREKDSLTRNMMSRKDKKMLDEDAWPDFYVKRDLFYPMFTHDYTFYEKHQPDIDEELLIDTLSELSMENEVHQLKNIDVKGRRRGRRAIDWKKPAYVLDAYELYNDLTDRGLSFGKLDMRQFPVQVCRYLYGNMNRYNSYNVDGRLEGSTYYRNYSPYSEPGSEVEAAGLFKANRTGQYVYARLKLKRLQDIRVYSDYEPRTEDSLMVEDRYSADATVELVPIPDDGEQPTFRDRHLVLHGVNVPEEFYQPDYSDRVPEGVADYRRTLYWNPNVSVDADGRLTVGFFNNGKETRVRVSAAGMTTGGRLLRTAPK